MSSQRGERFQPGFDHPGDRVFFEGKEYRVTEYSRRTNLAWLVSETDLGDNPGQINMDHLTVSWCPKSHGGAGRPKVAA